MTAHPSYRISESDIFRIAYIHLASHIGSYLHRAPAYVNETLADNPQVVVMQGVDPRENDLLMDLASRGTMIVGDYRKTMHELAPAVNAIWLAPNIELVSQRSFHVSTLGADGVSENVLAPDCIVATIRHRGRIMDIYNAESVPGVFHEISRIAVATIINNDAYITKTRRRGHFESLLILAGNMHAEPDAKSVRYLEGYDVIRGTAPSGWRDVWSELNMSVAPDLAATQRLEANAISDEELVLPQFMRAKRMSYFLVYNDVFGKIGTPISIERNGKGFTPIGGWPYSDTYGLTMGMFLPAVNPFTQEQ